MKYSSRESARETSAPRSYLEIIYSQNRKPASGYPAALAAYIAARFALKRGTLLDAGCGRGDMLRAFAAEGFDVTGCDWAPEVASLCFPYPGVCVNLSSGNIPLPPESFDVVFSKSVIEHIHDPMPMLKALLCTLKPQGKLVILTPSWLHTGMGAFYTDYTHVHPYTRQSLRDALLVSGFQEVTVSYFRQLPFLWQRSWLELVIATFAKLPLPYDPLHDMKIKWPTQWNKLIRFAKEVMLLGVARK